jgi:hypothetical protein
MLPFMSFLTTAKAVDPRRSDTSIHASRSGGLPNMVTSDSEASRNWDVLMPLSVIWTSWYERLSVSKNVDMAATHVRGYKNKK